MAINLRFPMLLIAACLCLPAHGQGVRPAKSSSPSTIELDVVVAPKSGGPAVTNLQKEDFTVLDNKAPQPIMSFKAVDGRQAQTKIIAVIDTVNTSYQQVAFERGEIEKFLRADGGHLAHPMQLAFVSDTGSQIQEGFSSDGNELSTALEKYSVGLRDLRPSAGIYGANERFRFRSRRCRR